MSTAVVYAVSAVGGREPCSLRPLAYVFDTDTLDALFESRSTGEIRTGGYLLFVYSGCRDSIDTGEYLSSEPLERLRRASIDGQSYSNGTCQQSRPVGSLLGITSGQQSMRHETARDHDEPILEPVSEDRTYLPGGHDLGNSEADGVRVRERASRQCATSSAPSTAGFSH